MKKIQTREEEELSMNYSDLVDSPNVNYGDFPEYAKLPKEHLRRLIFFQGLSAPETYLGDCPYIGQEARWWHEGKEFWYLREEGASICEHPYFKEKD